MIKVAQSIDINRPVDEVHYICTCRVKTAKPVILRAAQDLRVGDAWSDSEKGCAPVMQAPGICLAPFLCYNSVTDREGLIDLWPHRRVRMLTLLGSGVSLTGGGIRRGG
jgi:hypothetical protein